MYILGNNVDISGTISVEEIFVVHILGIRWYCILELRRVQRCQAPWIKYISGIFHIRWKKCYLHLNSVVVLRHGVAKRWIFISHAPYFRPLEMWRACSCWQSVACLSNHCPPVSSQHCISKWLTRDLCIVVTRSIISHFLVQFEQNSPAVISCQDCMTALFIIWSNSQFNRGLKLCKLIYQYLDLLNNRLYWSLN